MVLKSISNKSGAKGLLTYLFKNEEKLVSGKSKPIEVRHNIRSRTLRKWIQEFEENETFRLHKRKNAVKAYHTVLSFSGKDRKHITENMLRDIARQYIKLRGKDNL
jgi:hypothetical protein